MASIAILFANAHYTRESDLPCCLEDLAAVEALVRSAGRHDVIVSKSDATADEMRNIVRAALPLAGECEEVFFYFSGHGAEDSSEFYFCGTTFHLDRPNETGLSQTELHDLVRGANPELFVKVVDACFSGTLLVKSDQRLLPANKEGFRNLLQLASSLNNQQSFGGEPLSDFTRSFCEACVRKEQGPVYYADIVNTLRDDFIENIDQVPHFILQGTGRDLFVDDAATLVPFRDQLAKRWSRKRNGESPRTADTVSGADVAAVGTPSTKELLQRAEMRMGDPEAAEALIGKLFDGLVKNTSGDVFSDLFHVTSSDTNQYYESTARNLMVTVLSREGRPDRLVTAELRPDKKPSRLLGIFAPSALASLPNAIEDYDLSLNCSLARVQLRVALTPKFRALQQLVLVVSCAPSLEHCYVFEIVTQRPRTSWDTFDGEGPEVVRRWYKVPWNQPVDALVEKVTKALKDAMQTHLDEALSRIEKDQ